MKKLALAWVLVVALVGLAASPALAVAVSDEAPGKAAAPTVVTKSVTWGSGFTLWDLGVLVLGLTGTILAIDALVNSRAAVRQAQEAKAMAEQARRLAGKAARGERPANSALETADA